MPNIASALKAEIVRLARKELRTENASLRLAVNRYRSEIATLKKRISVVEKVAGRLARGKKPEVLSAGDEESGLRFRPTGFANHRKRLGISAADCGKLLGVSGLTVYKWEKGETKPRRSHLPAIAELRALGKREAQARLTQLSE